MALHHVASLAGQMRCEGEADAESLVVATDDQTEALPPNPSRLQREASG